MIAFGLITVITLTILPHHLLNENKRKEEKEIIVLKDC